MTEKFKQITEAYDILSNVELRRQYDAAREEAATRQHFHEQS